MTLSPRDTAEQWPEKGVDAAQKSRDSREIGPRVGAIAR